MNRLFISALILLLCTACAKAPLTPHQSAKADYEKAKRMVDDGGYDEADLFLERFIIKYPYSDYASNAEILRIYGTYKGGRLELTQTLAKRFKKRHPRHPDLAYVQYMLAMAYYKQRARSDREQAPTLKAMAAFESLIKGFPDSSYAKEALPRLQTLKNTLAEHEVAVGRFYFQQRRYVGAANRFQVVLNEYQRSPAIEEALYYLAASYAALNMASNAREIALLLRHNYPKGDWFNKAEDFL